VAEPEALGAEFVALQRALAGRYSLERELGRGGMGIVFLARDVALDRPVAIKLLPPLMAAQPALRERFVREAQLSARLSHPNIIPIYAVEQAGELVFFVMAFVDGPTLGQRVREKGPLTPREGTRLIQEVAWALAYAHARGIVHRDIKPDNILLEAGTGRALVSDFGIARAAETSGATAAGEVLGTAQYMSPEQACGEPVDGRSDLYSLGVVAFFALSGRLPFEARDIPALLAMHITQPAPLLASVAPGAPRRLAQAVHRCLAKDPAERFPTGEALADAVAAAEVARDLPAPIRVWLTKGEMARPLLYSWTILIGGGTLVEWIVEMARSGRVTPDLDNIVGIAVPWLVFVLYRLYHTQRVLFAGYGYEDLRLALRQHIERRKEELAFEYDRAPPWWARLIRWAAYGALGVAGATVAYVLVTPVPNAVLTGYLLGGSAAVAIGGGILGRIFPGKRLKARDSLLEYRARLMDSWFGRLLHRLAAFGVQPAALPAGATHRPTEIAIGLAVEALFEALPRETRKALRELPDVVARLEADARAMRARVDELNGMLADLGGEGAAAKSSTLAASAAGGVVADEQARVREDLTRTRDAAGQQLAATVAALENLRLDLLRLKAGVGSVDELSADLAAARDLQSEIALAIRARREVEAALGPASSTPPRSP
jgi:serine/threonine-protein kinase